ncbi:MAG: hypothetical protein WD928_00345 [Gammaproteobacteria bacterium]
MTMRIIMAALGLAGAVAASADDAVFEGTSLPLEARRLVEDLSTCAAYYFNATKARPLREYEALYGAGERAMNRASRLLDRPRVDRLVGDAAVAMTAMTGGNWHHYHRVTARYGDFCAELVGEAQ